MTGSQSQSVKTAHVDSGLRQVLSIIATQSFFGQESLLGGLSLSNLFSKQIKAVEHE